jgi:hypothetical protein
MELRNISVNSSDFGPQNKIAVKIAEETLAELAENFTYHITSDEWRKTRGRTEDGDKLIMEYSSFFMNRFNEKVLIFDACVGTSTGPCHYGVTNILKGYETVQASLSYGRIDKLDMELANYLSVQGFEGHFISLQPDHTSVVKPHGMDTNMHGRPYADARTIE